jgi:hypothetical protein
MTAHEVGHGVVDARDRARRHNAIRILDELERCALITRASIPITSIDDRSAAGSAN